MSKPTPETDAACPYCKAMPMGMVAKVRWTCGSYGGPTGRSEQCKERANAWEQRDEAGKELSSIHRWIERNHADGFIDSLTYLQNLERVTDSWYDRIDAIETDARRFVRERDEARVALASEIALADRLAHNLKIASHAWNNPTEHPAITDWKKARHE